MMQRFEELKVWESLNFERTVLRTAVYLLLAVVALLCAFYNIIYGIQFSARDNDQWLISVCISLAGGASGMWESLLFILSAYFIVTCALGVRHLLSLLCRCACRFHLLAAAGDSGKDCGAVAVSCSAQGC